MPRPINDHNSDGLIQKAKERFNTAEMRAWHALDKQTSRMWRNFWIRVIHRQGYTNAEIAKEFEIGESTVRMVLKKQGGGI